MQYKFGVHLFGSTPTLATKVKGKRYREVQEPDTLLIKHKKLTTWKKRFMNCDSQKQIVKSQ